MGLKTREVRNLVFVLHEELVTPYQGIQNSLELYIPRHGFWFQKLDSILCQWNLDSGLQSFVGFRIISACVADVI